MIDSSGLPHPTQEEDLTSRVRSTLDGLQSLVQLIREDTMHPRRIKAYVTQADKLLRTLHNDLWQILP